MNLIKRITNKIKAEINNIFLRFKYLGHKCIIKSKVKINKQTILESRIVVGKESDITNAHIGYGTYLAGYCDFNNCHIGRFCSIALHSKVIRGLHPTRGFVSTHPSFFSTMKQAGFTFVNNNIFNEYEYADNSIKVSVVIGNDVWIGYGAKILEGVVVGDGAIIGAGSLVTKDVEPYSIVAGVPAKIIRYRFTMEQIKFLMEFKWWERDIQWISNNSKLFIDIDNFYENFRNK